MSEWKPRTIDMGIDVPTTGLPDSFLDGTPEHKLAEYLLYWKMGNYGRMAQCLYMYDTPPNKAPSKVRENYSTKKLRSFEFIEILDEAAAVTEIKTKLLYKEDDCEVERVIDFRLIYKGPNDTITVRGKPECSWMIYTFFV